MCYKLKELEQSAEPKEMKKTHEKGYTFIEVIGVLGIAGMLMASMSMLVSSMFDKYKKNRVQDQILMLEKLINQRYVADKNYKDISADTLIDEGIVPAEMKNGNKIVQAYGDVTIAGSEDTYTIEFNKLPLNVCMALGMMDWVYGDSSDLVSVTVNGSKYSWPYIGKQTDDSALPLDVARLSQKCQRQNNVIKWEFQ